MSQHTQDPVLRAAMEDAREAAWMAYRFGTPEKRGPGYTDSSPISAWEAGWNAALAAQTPSPTGNEAPRGENDEDLPIALHALIEADAILPRDAVLKRLENTKASAAKQNKIWLMNTAHMAYVHLDAAPPPPVSTEPAEKPGRKTADVGVFGPIDGMGNRDLSGSYIGLSVSGKHFAHGFHISIGAAETLSAELAGLLGSEVSTEPDSRAGAEREALTESRLREIAKELNWYVREGTSVPQIDGGWRHPFTVTADSRDLCEMVNCLSAIHPSPPTASGAAAPVGEDAKRDRIAGLIRTHVRLEWYGHDHADINPRSVTAAADAILSCVEHADA